MAININDVYQKVQVIANKEQRGYVTPQEFNVFANQAQMDIFEQYFYDLNVFLRAPGNDTTHGDPIDILKEKIDQFERYRQAVAVSSGGVGVLPDHYRMGELYFYNANCTGGPRFIEIEKINQNEIHHIQNSPLTAPSNTLPAYVHTTGYRNIQLYPITITAAVCNYIARPAQAVWGYTVANGQALYNSSSTTNFELHQAEEPNLVFKILELAGISMKNPNLYSQAAAEEAKDLQEEKQ